MRALEERARAIGARAAGRRRDAVVREVAEVPGVSAHVEGEDVVIEGRALLDRWVADARLRYLGRSSS